MRLLSDFYARLLPHVTGCPEPLANQALVDAAIAFCEDSKVVRRRLDVFQTVAGQDVYEFDVPAQQRISRITKVLISGVPLVSAASEDAVFWQECQGKPTVFTTVRVDSELLLKLHPVADAAYAVEVEAVLCPTRNATQLEDDLFDRWVEPVLFGAMGRIKAVPGQPFSDPVGSMAYTQRAFTTTNKAKVEAQFDSVQSARRIRPVRFV